MKYHYNNKKTLLPIILKSVMFGCDPEFFLTKKGKIIESEDVITEGGIKHEFGNKNPIVVIDGIQAELNPDPNTCRESVASSISYCFYLLSKKMSDDVKADFSQTIDIPKGEFNKITDKSKKFGCDKSFNTNGDDKSKIKIDPDTCRKRSAGGHIHLGLDDKFNIDLAGALGSCERLVPLLDILVGNTCVLLDRDEGNIERRKIYGKAGEYRTPKHGLEYRVLSNFWLRSYPLMSLVMGLSRVAVNIIIAGREYESKLTGAVGVSDIAKAINTNDFDLAMSNFKKIEPILLEFSHSKKGFNSGYEHPITEKNIKQFHKFVKKGINHYFKDEPVKYWADKRENGLGNGWDRFINKIK